MAMEEREFDPEQVRQPYLPTEENIQNMTRRLSAEDKVYTNSGIEIYQLYAGSGGHYGN
jgi:predicted amino acid racemase